MKIKCPYCDGTGVSRYSAPGFKWPCTICDGTGVCDEKEVVEVEEEGDENNE